MVMGREFSGTTRARDKVDYLAPAGRIDTGRKSPSITVNTMRRISTTNLLIRHACLSTYPSIDGSKLMLAEPTYCESALRFWLPPIPPPHCGHHHETDDHVITGEPQLYYGALWRYGQRLQAVLELYLIRVSRYTAVLP